jgi:cytochrome c oxidase cbb3-type subunit 3
MLVVTCALLAYGCKREERGFRVEPPAASRTEGRSLSNLYPGTPNPPPPPQPVENEFEENAYAVSEGKTLFNKYNCSGCHANGGGGIGPALMDDKWIYGGNPENIYATIVEGRPNGMPSWRGRIPDYQLWQLVAYVRSLSGNVPKDIPSARPEDMKTHKQEAASPTKPPQQSTEPNPGGGSVGTPGGGRP